MTHNTPQLATPTTRAFKRSCFQHELTCFQPTNLTRFATSSEADWPPVCRTVSGAFPMLATNRSEAAACATSAACSTTHAVAPCKPQTVRPVLPATLKYVEHVTSGTCRGCKVRRRQRGVCASHAARRLTAASCLHRTCSVTPSGAPLSARRVDVATAK